MATSSLPTSTRRPGIERARARTAVWLLVPTLLAIAFVAGYPLFRTIYLSFTDANLGSTDAPRLVGFSNYASLLADPAWWGAVRNTVVFTVFSVGFEFVLGLAFALVINSKFRGRGLMRTAILVPWAIPTVVSAQMWSWMYNDNFGVVTDILLRLGVMQPGESLLANPITALPAIIAVDVWKTAPFVALLLLAGLQSIPSDMYEAADVDGASKVTQFFRLTLPLLVPAILVTLIFRTLDALRVFDVIFVMKGYAPESVSMSAFARQQLVDFQLLGAGSAASVLIFLVVMIFTVIYVTSLRVKFD
ncbi:carbohydrate ABC transporter permease [Deinococcus yavapaiensis]|uniref:Maltose ABC transporter membrane protein /trehalose ABC transporter membrane protein /sucrose ABC transporter membrane protein /palatinose ABC transporter membrane protein n=1 Tax=Deinococcus yavapaiensis KR-236 TaxID=694435 RepID=A0A318S6Z4_9DEIO|nr:sugar ABC transporter permease [Deinococcus yavapaiensis]PYE54746.1 maltose ABC transporter membrane protein /trehalose ABC transporter membrane protein /sucrose ABC transporter membrane protein /palatinose ABC transporter membrane protein [Deinococcus yavapaiensis KR-236]